MKEIVLREARHLSLNIPATELAGFREVRALLAQRSTVVWGEHCSECAFPSCYASCEFYTPRSDMHCRRFANGIEEVVIPGAPDIKNLTRIQFRRWGKLEGSGPATLYPTDAAYRKEASANSTDKFFAALPLPKRIGNGIANRMNAQRKQQAVTEGPLQSSSSANVFVIEGWLEHDTAINMTVSMMPWDKSIDGLFQKQFTFRKGYNREVISCQTIKQSMSIDQPFAIQIEVVGDPPNQPVIFGLVDFAEVAAGKTLTSATAAPVAKTGKAKTAKCVVWDLDDTVWTGTLVEDGIEGVQLKPGVAETMRMLDSRGILNSVASKNDEDLALAALKHFGLSEYILFPQVSWGPKSDALRRIAESIDIGIDTFVFVDDQPFERGEVGAAHPSVTLMTPEDVAGFATHALFDVPVTEESKKRRLLYRDEEKRQRAATSSGTDYLGFLRSCNIELDVLPVTKDSAERIYELTQRTNQLNVTGARFTREEVRQFVDGTTSDEGFVLRCRDTFGDYGIIGFCVLNREQHRINAFFMSCRVQRKRVEQAFFAWLSESLIASGADSLTINYRKTAKNGASVRMFADLGFVLEESAPVKAASLAPYPTHGRIRTSFASMPPHRATTLSNSARKSPTPMMAKISNRLARLDTTQSMKLRLNAPVASFTFDDFPASAYTIAGKMLEDAGVRGTYFAAGEFLNTSVDGIEYYNAELLKTVHENGHEIGCHAFNHVHLSRKGADFARNTCEKNSELMRGILGEQFMMTSFAYPFGDVSPSVKRAMTQRFALCRGVYQRLNTGSVDVAQIRIVSLESRHWNEQDITNTIADACRNNSWLVFLTHDISNSPTPYGSTAAMIEFTLRALQQSQVPIMTLKAAAAHSFFGAGSH
ncbi:MAG: HAD-IIIC family phosphatase [Steroidobacteraceae bacterium]